MAMDPDEARRRVREGGTFLCMDVPQGAPGRRTVRARDIAVCMRAEASVCRRVTNGSHSGAGTELHCDLAGLVAGPKFRGIKMLPPGLHLFCWDAGQVRPSTVTMESAPLALASRTADYPLGN